MSRCVWKYQLSEPGGQVVQVPRGAKFLHFANQENGGQCVWAEVDTAEPREWVQFRIHGTGQSIPAAGEYVGTLLDGPFVRHLYVVRP